MARPNKEGLDYFPLDVDMDQDDKVALIEAEHGVIGFSVVIKLFMKIYKEGYFYKWSEKEQLLLSRKINVDINTIRKIVIDCIKWDIFNKKIFDEYKVLTSKGIQKRYLEAITRRKEALFIKEYLLIDIAESLGASKIAVYIVDKDNNRINVNINSNSERKNDVSKPQSKVKEKESKEIKDYTPQIKNLLSRYPEGFADLNKAYWEVIRETRTSKKIQQSVYYKTMEKWSDYPVKVVEYALKKHIELGSDKDEKYTIGIMRKTTTEEAVDKLDRMKPKGVRKDENSSIYDNLF